MSKKKFKQVFKFSLLAIFISSFCTILSMHNPMTKQQFSSIVDQYARNKNKAAGLAVIEAFDAFKFRNQFTTQNQTIANQVLLQKKVYPSRIRQQLTEGLSAKRQSTKLPITQDELKKTIDTYKRHINKANALAIIDAYNTFKFRNKFIAQNQQLAHKILQEKNISLPRIRQYLIGTTQKATTKQTPKPPIRRQPKLVKPQQPKPQPTPTIPKEKPISRPTIPAKEPQVSPDESPQPPQVSEPPAKAPPSISEQEITKEESTTEKIVPKEQKPEDISNFFTLQVDPQTKLKILHIKNERNEFVPFGNYQQGPGALKLFIPTEFAQEKLSALTTEDVETSIEHIISEINTPEDKVNIINQLWQAYENTQPELNVKDLSLLNNVDPKHIKIKQALFNMLKKAFERYKEQIGSYLRAKVADSIDIGLFFFNQQHIEPEIGIRAYLTNAQQLLIVIGSREYSIHDPSFYKDIREFDTNTIITLANQIRDIASTEQATNRILYNLTTALKNASNRETKQRLYKLAQPTLKNLKDTKTKAIFIELFNKFLNT